ncbi:MAG: hypothetical protein Ct9H90mP11_11060 [Acidimicrobiales bacterium]|nr:MAG: hypothetical protein Ct9H90mP11_11060 [Acidimicrobiales bacterium]
MRIPRRTEPEGVYEANNFANDDGEIAEIKDLLLSSSNCGFLKLGQLAGLNNIISTARLMGINLEMDPVISLPLGVEEVSPMEMANAYGTLASGGDQREPYFIERIERFRMTNGFLSMNIVKMTDTCRNGNLTESGFHAGLPMPYGQMCAKAPEIRAGWPMGSQPAAGKKRNNRKNF